MWFDDPENLQLLSTHRYTGDGNDPPHTHARARKSSPCPPSDACACPPHRALKMAPETDHMRALMVPMGADKLSNIGRIRGGEGGSSAGIGEWQAVFGQMFPRNGQANKNSSTATFHIDPQYGEPGRSCLAGHPPPVSLVLQLPPILLSPRGCRRPVPFGPLVGEGVGPHAPCKRRQGVEETVRDVSFTTLPLFRDSA